MIVLLMGPTGSGKTTVGSLLAAQLGWTFADGDHFHPPENIEKMRQGIPLDDSDRLPWLDALRGAMERWLAEGKNIVLTCSALKEAYRERLGIGPGIHLVYLKGSYDLVLQRLRQRHGHFATEAILAGQFADLEEPSDALSIDIRHSPEEMVSEIRRELQLT